jgi:hypothetical protein
MVQVPSNKPFCKENYKANNRPGIDTSLNFLNQFGFQIVDDGQKEAYCSHDCQVQYSGQTYLIEAEKSNVWRDTNERQHDITVPYRKHKSNADIFVMCNETMTALIVGSMKEIKASEVKTKWVYSSQMDEPFFFVDYKNFDYYKKVNNEWVCVANNANILERIKPKSSI